MPNLSLGTIEVLGLPAAVEAADVACKTADVTLIGYETTDGMGMVAVKIEGQVSAVKSAVAAAAAAAGRVTKVFATSVIARPSDQLEPVVLTTETVGLRKAEPTPVQAATAAEPLPATPEPEPAPAAQPAAEAVPAEDSDRQVTPTQVEPSTDAAPKVGPVTLKPQGSRRSPMKPRSVTEE